MSSHIQALHDVHLVSSVEVARVMRQYRIEVERLESEEKEYPMKRAKTSQVVNIVTNYHQQLQNLHNEWNDRFISYPRPDGQ